MVRDFHEKHGFLVGHDFDEEHARLASQDRRALSDAAGDLVEHAKIMLVLALDGRNPDGEKNLMTRLHLIVEETGELCEATSDGDKTKAFDALIDLAYVVVGTAVALGMPLPEGFAEVHRSNMTKQKQPTDPHAARLRDKGPNYDPPQLEKILEKGMA